MQPDANEIAKLYDKKFGRGWRSAMARALNVKNATISDARPGPTLSALALLFEFFDAMPVRSWPDRWTDMRTLARKQARKGTE